MDGTVDPVMRTNCKEDHCLCVFESKDDAITLVNTKTPHRLLFRVEFFHVEDWCKWVSSEESCPPFRFLLYRERQFAIPLRKLIRIQYVDHIGDDRRSRKERSFFTRPLRTSCSARAILLRKSREKKPKFPASRSKRSRSSSTVTLPFSFVNVSGIVAILV